MNVYFLSTEASSYPMVTMDAFRSSAGVSCSKLKLNYKAPISDYD